MIKMIKYTTVCIDIFGRVYDLGEGDHPSWQQVKEEGKKAFYKCIVADSFTCTEKECARLKAKAKRKRR